MYEVIKRKEKYVDIKRPNSLQFWKYVTQRLDLAIRPIAFSWSARNAQNTALRIDHSYIVARFLIVYWTHTLSKAKWAEVTQASFGRNLSERKSV
jgi:hypothetical protein